MRLTRWRPAFPDASSSPRRRLLSAAGLLVVTGLLLAGPTAGAENDFFYPAAAHACLGRAAARSACRGDSVGELNACLCGNGSGFVTETARCLGAAGGGGELAAVYATMEAACDGSQTPLCVSQTEFLALAGKGGRTSKAPPRTTAVSRSPPRTTTREAATKTMTSEASTAAPSTSTPASTSASATPSPTDVGGSAFRHQLSQGATVGIATGASVGGVAAVARSQREGLPTNLGAGIMFFTYFDGVFCA